MNRKIYVLVALLLTLLPLGAFALDSLDVEKTDDAPSLGGKIQRKNPGAKNVMIINSYYSSSPVVRNILKPVLTRVADDPNISCDLFNLNGQLITDSLSFEYTKQSLFDACSNDTPDYVVMIGKIAFNLRDEVKKRWGDVPILLVAQTGNYAPLNYYFAGVENPAESTVQSSLQDLRQEYNFSAVIVPDYYIATVDLIIKMRPEIKTLVFASDESFLNRYEAYEIRNHLIAEYPGIKFRWLNANAENAKDFQRYLGTPDPTLGMLLSSWSYGRRTESGSRTITTTELNLIFASANPIFCYNEAFLNYGAVGGVFPNMEKIQEEIGEIFDKMINGESMRKIPFYLNQNDYITVMDFPSMKEYDLKIKDCPKNTKFLNRPLSFWEKYHWEVISISLVVLIVLFMMWKHNLAQQREIRTLNRHKKFVDKMPIPFSKANVSYNKDGKVANINYTLKNDAFFRLIHDNAIPDNPFLLFPAHFISGKVSELLETRKDVKFSYNFEKTETWYEFILSLVDDSNVPRRDKAANLHVKEIDIFAIDITNRVTLEEELKDITSQLDLTINVSGIIPWFWDLKTDELKFDAYSLFERYSHTFSDDSNKKAQMALIDALDEFFPLVHPEDYDGLYGLREDLYAKRTDSFRYRYRIRLARDGEDYYQWVEIRGRVIEKDKEGNPLRVAGSMWCIDEEDVPENDTPKVYKKI